jgi:hypothetical protein
VLHTGNTGLLVFVLAGAAISGTGIYGTTLQIIFSLDPSHDQEESLANYDHKLPKVVTSV